MRIKLKDVFRFAEHHEKATFVLGYKLRLTRKVENSVSNKASLVKLKLTVLKGLYRIIQPVFHSNLCYLSRF